MTRWMVARIASICAALVFFPAVSAEAEPASVSSSAHRHAISVTVGAMNDSGIEASVSVGANDVSTGVNATAWIGYSYTAAADWAVDLEVGWIGTRAEISVTRGSAGTQTTTVVPLLIGARYQPRAFAIGARGQAFLSALVGPYVATTSGVATSPVAIAAATETSFGARLGGGVDILLGSHFRLGGVVRYNAVTDFAESVGGLDAIGGLEAGVSFGVLWGKGPASRRSTDSGP